MTKNSDRGRRAFEIGTDGATVAALVVDIGATGGALSGGKLLWDAVTAGLGYRRRRQAEAFLELLADALGEADVASLAVALDKAEESPVWETIEEGFRAIVAAINETSKRCIALLVADYFKRQDLPDREFQLLAGLLAASDEPILRGLLAVTSQLTEVYVEPPDDHNSLLAHTYGFYRAHNDVLGGVGIHVLRTRRHAKAVQSSGELRPANLAKVVRLLEWHELGQIPETRDAKLQERGRLNWTMEIRVDADEALMLKRLHTYVRPVFF